MIVKVCGITSTEDAQAAVEAGADAIGFNFYPPSPRYISPRDAGTIARQLPSHVVKAGVFVQESPAFVNEVLEHAGLDVAQVIGISPAGVRVWQVRKVTDTFSPAELDDDLAEAYLLDTPSAALHGGTGESFDWRRARIESRRVILAGGLGPDNVAAAVAAARPWGVDACSRLEFAPGRKDHQLVKAFVAAARNS